MRIAVIGGGTAGFIAASHLSRHLPEAELLHIFDSTLPTIGVGEGTTPRFPGWFEEVTGLGFPVLAERCGATLKKGTRFEGWGRANETFLNRFQPTRLLGYHFQADKVVEVLAEHVRAQRLDARVERLVSTPKGVTVQLAGGTTYECQYAFDARGFPRAQLEEGLRRGDLLALDCIPTDRALIRWSASAAGLDCTRAIARPHGWIFQIPLRDRTSSGYIFNGSLSSEAEVGADFDAFLEGEGVGEWSERGVIPFPNFVRRRWCDGRVFHVGNAASFVEPLEATAIGTAIVQVREATEWIKGHPADGAVDPDELDAINGSMLTFVGRNGLFIGWHYARGSRWDTPFWSYAEQGMARAEASPYLRGHLGEMEDFVEAGRSVPGLTLPFVEDEEQWQREVYPLLSLYRPFGNFSELNFAQVGHGIGYYDARRETGVAIAVGTPA